MNAIPPVRSDSLETLVHGRFPAAGKKLMLSGSYGLVSPIGVRTSTVTVRQ